MYTFNGLRLNVSFIYRIFTIMIMRVSVGVCMCVYFVSVCPLMQTPQSEYIKLPLRF